MDEKLYYYSLIIEKYLDEKNLSVNSLYLISARKLLRCSFEEYLRIIKDEFSRKTIDEEQDKLLINIRGRVSMKVEDIDNGINLGKQLIAQRQGKTQNP